MKRIILLLSLLVVMTVQVVAADAQTDACKDKDRLQ